MKRFFFPDPPGGGGPVLPPALSDLDPASFGHRITPSVDPIKPIVDKDVIPPIDDPSKIDPNKPKEPAPEGKMYNDKGEIVDDPNYKKPIDPANPEPEPELEIPEEVAFWETVEKLTGRPVKVEYPTGIDPISPEGVALRENAVRVDTEEAYDAKIKNKYPHAYAFMIHHMEGGSDADFFEQNGSVSLPERASVETSADLQVTFIKNDLMGKVDPEVVQAHVDKLIKDNKLKDAALKVYDKIEVDQKKELENLERYQRVEKAKTDKAIADMTTTVGNALKNASFTIPEADLSKVSDFVTNNLQYDKASGQFYIVQPVSQAELATQLDMLIYNYYKGDLNKIIHKKAQTQATQRLRTQANKTQTNKVSTPDPLNNPGGYIPLGSMGKD